MEYYIIIAGSLCIILSYLFNGVSKKTNIPSVLLLIALGVITREVLIALNIPVANVLQTFKELNLLAIFGTLGLILIVLEAALELKIEKEKLGVIAQSFSIASVGLLICLFAISFLIFRAWPEISFKVALIYATPLSILSSAIVIPSVINLDKQSEEFHIYESTFSDILGIIVFYFLLEFGDSTKGGIVFSEYALKVLVTIILSILLSYILIYVFQNLETKVKLFLMISVLILLFSLGKLLHLSSLLVILIFGLILNNHGVFFLGKLKRYLKPLAIAKINESFLLITIESAFVIRTFFFIIFGFSITISDVFDVKVALLSAGILLIIYVTRLLSILPFKYKNIKQSLGIAPRGLITLLLFYSIPKKFQFEDFPSGILLLIIISTSLIMTFTLIQNQSKKIEGDLSEAK
jgi:NhaP-type Na+/H+ or K+/H+ antiporter